MILAIDPGKEKCGMALLSEQGEVMAKKITPRVEIVKDIIEAVEKDSLAFIVVGQSAFGREVKKELVRLDLKASIFFVSEKNSTLEARSLYWQEHKPKGWWKFIPTSLRVPPVPIDDYAAVILGKRYLKG